MVEAAFAPEGGGDAQSRPTLTRAQIRATRDRLLTGRVARAARFSEALTTSRTHGCQTAPMQLERTYERTLFAADVLEEAVAVLREMGGDTLPNNVRYVGRANDMWHVESEEEFFGLYRQGFDRASLSASRREPTLSVDCWGTQQRSGFTPDGALTSSVWWPFSIATQRKVSSPSPRRPGR